MRMVSAKWWKNVSLIIDLCTLRINWGQSASRLKLQYVKHFVMTREYYLINKVLLLAHVSRPESDCSCYCLKYLHRLWRAAFKARKTATSLSSYTYIFWCLLFWHSDPIKAQVWYIQLETVEPEDMIITDSSWQAMWASSLTSHHIKDYAAPWWC